MLSRVLVLGACALAFLGALPSVSRDASAGVQGEVETSLSNKDLEAILEKGMQVKYKETSAGNYKAEIAGRTILFHNHTTDLQLFCGFKKNVSLGKINEWNATKRYCRAYLDKDGDAVLKSDFDIGSGVTEKGLAEFVSSFVKNATEFAEFIGFKG